MEDLLNESDFVVLAVNLSPETTGLISHTQLSLMKPTATLVNISRGEDARGSPGLCWCPMKDVETVFPIHTLVSQVRSWIRRLWLKLCRNEGYEQQL